MYELYFGKVLFPVAPEEVKIKIKNQNTQLSLINEGELNILKSPGLSEISMKLLLPSRRYHFALYKEKFQDERYYLSVLERLKTKRAVFDFSLIRSKSNTKKNLNMQVTLEDYSIQESAGEMGDMTADVTLRQYIHFGTKVVKIKDNESTEEGTSRPGDKGDKEDTQGQKSYVIKEEDTLWSISIKFYGVGTRDKEIYKANKKLLDKVAVEHGFPQGTGHWWIFAGTKIVIPKKVGGE